MDRTPPRFREPVREEKEDSDTEEEKEKQEEKELVPEEPPQPAVKKKVSDYFVEVREENTVCAY